MSGFNLPCRLSVDSKEIDVLDPDGATLESSFSTSTAISIEHMGGSDLVISVYLATTLARQFTVMAGKRHLIGADKLARKVRCRVTFKCPNGTCDVAFCAPIVQLLPTDASYTGKVVVTDLTPDVIAAAVNAVKVSAPATEPTK